MKRALSLVLAAALVLGSVPAGFAATSTAGETLKGYGLVAGDTNGNLNEDKTITRGEMMVVLARLLGKFEEAKAYSIPSTSKDVAGHWAANYIAYAEKEGWTAGKGNGMFDPQGTVTLQEVSVFMLKALGYTADWNTAVKAATDLGLLKEVVATDAAAKVLRSDVFTSALNTINTPVKDSTVKLGEKLGVLKPVVVAEKVDVKSAVALNSKVVEVALNTAIKTVDAKAFTVKDAAGAAVNVTAAELAAYDATGKTVLVTLEKDTTAGTLYTLTAEAKNVNFGGRAADTTKPSISSITSTDYNEVTVVFDEAIKLETAKITLAKKYVDKAALAITATKYKNATTLVLTTADQTDATLYAAVVEGATDFAGNVMTKDEAKTFVGTAKSTAAQTVVAAKALDYKTIYVEFGVNVDTTTVAAANFTLAEMYGTKAAVAIADAKMATTAQAYKYNNANNTTLLKEAAAKKGVVLTLTGEVKDATLYKVAVTKVATLYGKALSTTEADTYKTFTGVAKPAADSVVYTAAATSNTTVDLTFANDVDPVSGAVAANYTIAKAYGDKAALAVTKAEVDANVVTLTVAPMTVDMYKVTAVNVKDVYGNSIKTTSDANIQGFAGKAVAAKISSISTIVDTTATTGTIRVTFNGNYGDGALNVASYTLDNSIGYPSKVVSVSGSTTAVDLTIPKTVTGKLYTLTVKGVKNSDGVAMDAAGLTKTFVGTGGQTATYKLEAAQALDSKTLKLYFNTAIDDLTALNQTSATTLAGEFTVTGGTAGAFSGAGAVLDRAFVDPTNDHVIIAYTTNAFDSGTSDMYTVTAAAAGLTASYTAVSFAENTNAPATIKVDGISAINDRTLVVYFNQPIRHLANTFATVTTSADVLHSNISAVRVLSDDNMSWELSLATPIAAAGQYNLLLAANDATKIAQVESGMQTAALGTTLKFAFAGSTTQNLYVKDVYAVATDSRTIKVFYPEAMKATGLDGTDAANIANYTVVNGSDVDVTNSAIVKAVYDAKTNVVTLTTNTDFTTSTTGYFLKVANTVTNALGTKTVKASASADLKTQFALSTVAPAKALVKSVSYTAGTKTLVITMNQSVKSSNFAVAYDAAAFVKDFVVKMTVGGTSTEVAAADITSVTTTATNAAFGTTFTVVLGAGFTPDTNAAGTVAFDNETTVDAAVVGITGINGQTADTSMTPVVFAH